jgi:AcrR family transcriptional regulator
VTDAAPGSRRVDAVRNRRRVLDAARAVFAEHGVTAPIVEVAHGAGVGVGTVYRHFPTKEALFEAILRDDLAGVVVQVRERATQGEPGPAFFGLIELLLAEGRRSTGLKDALAGGGHDVQAALAEVTTELLAVVEAALGRAQHAGAVRTDVGWAEVMAVVAAAFSVIRNHSDDDFTAHVIAVMLDGLRPPPSDR